MFSIPVFRQKRKPLRTEAFAFPRCTEEESSCHNRLDRAEKMFYMILTGTSYYEILQLRV